MIDINRIFLDLDGTLLHGKDRHYFCYKKIASDMGFSVINIDEYWEKKRAKISLNNILGPSNIANHYAKFITEWLRLIESPELLELDELHDGVLELLRGWNEKGIELILVTMRQDAGALEQQLKKLGLRKHLDQVLVCSKQGVGSSKALHVENSLKGNPLFREGALWIGDTEADWEAANYLGVDLLLVENGLRNREYLKTLGEGPVISSIGDSNKFIKIT